MDGLFSRCLQGCNKLQPLLSVSTVINRSSRGHIWLITYDGNLITDNGNQTGNYIVNLFVSNIWMIIHITEYSSQRRRVVDSSDATAM
jgi:hypothetical protein